MRVGIICEGQTDYPVLRAVIAAVCRDPGIVIVPLCPDSDRLHYPATGPLASGWQAVRAFLQTSGDFLAIGTFDLVVVQVDADVLPKLSAQLLALPEDPPGGLDALCRHIKGWAREALPAHVVVVLPRSASEAWLLAAHTKVKRVEEIEDPAEELVQRDLLQRAKDGSVRKSSATYRQLAEALADLSVDERRLEELPELARFVGKVLEVQKVVKGAKKGR